MPSRGKATRGKATGGTVFARVHAWVEKIPRGKVATYGQLSELIDGRLSAVGVGWALRAGPERLPWHRVVNASGGLSTEKETPGRQRTLLRAEGVRFLADGKIDMERHQWRPRAKPARRRTLRGL
jgi:methylated-DNA-protein-cysteine methyltransferase-like protein